MSFTPDQLLFYSFIPSFSNFFFGPPSSLQCVSNSLGSGDLGGNPSPPDTPQAGDGLVSPELQRFALSAICAQSAEAAFYLGESRGGHGR